MKYPPLFKRVPLDNKEPNNIALIQQHFEDFWKKINPLLLKSPEKTLGMRSLQEACMWLSRAGAIDKFKGSDNNGAPRIEHVFQAQLKEINKNS